MSDLAKEYNVRLIYRNNHYNKRFGALCADANIERMINGSRWEIWDNRRVSKGILDQREDSQTDGLHFDRFWLNSYEQHKEHYQNTFFSHPEVKILQGMLEMQLSQSFLNHLYHDCLEKNSLTHNNF